MKRNRRAQSALETLAGLRESGERLIARIKKNGCPDWFVTWAATIAGRTPTLLVYSTADGATTASYALQKVCGGAMEWGGVPVVQLIAKRGPKLVRGR